MVSCHDSPFDLGIEVSLELSASTSCSLGLVVAKFALESLSALRYQVALYLGFHALIFSAVLDYLL